MTPTKTATAPAKKTAAKKTTATTDKTAAAKDTIVFHGRKMKVKKPTEGQLAVWQRMATRYTGVANPSEVEAGRILDRLMAVIESVIVNDTDRDWLEDLMMAGEVDLGEAANIVKETVDLYYGGQIAPTTGPQPKARRHR